jgi:hypothetical protein
METMPFLPSPSGNWAPRTYLRPATGHAVNTPQEVMMILYYPDMILDKRLVLIQTPALPVGAP